MIQGRILVTLLVLLGYLPLDMSRHLGRFIGNLSWWLPNRNRRITRENIARCYPELSNKEQELLAQQSLQHTGMLLLETTTVWQRSPAWLAGKIETVHNKSLFDQAINQGKGVILLVPHLGNWEVLGKYITSLTKVVALYKPPGCNMLEAYITKNREKTGATLVPTSLHGVATLLKHLRSGGVTYILPDQVPNQHDKGCIMATFYKKSVLTMTLVHQLQQKTDCVLLAATALRTDNGFKINFYKVPQEIYSTDKQLSLNAMNRLIEYCIQSAPEQYQWEYRRFRAAKNCHADKTQETSNNAQQLIAD